MSVAADAANEAQIKQSGHDILTIAMDMIESGEATGVVIIVATRLRLANGETLKGWLTRQRNKLTFSDGTVCTFMRVPVLFSASPYWLKELHDRAPNAVVKVLEWRL